MVNNDAFLLQLTPLARDENQTVTEGNNTAPILYRAKILKKP